MRNVNYKKLGDRLLMTIEAYQRHRSVQFIREERKRCFPLVIPVYEELFEQVGRSLWGL